METRKINCTWFICGKKSKRTYNLTLQKWARKSKCKCGSQSFNWSEILNLDI